MLLLEDKMMKYAREFDNIDIDDFYIYEDDDWSEIQSYAEDTFYKEAYIDSGATKLVIIDDSCATVLKVPFRGSWRESGHYEYDDDGDNREWVEDDPCRKDFYGADGTWDYCGLEEEMYNIAKDAGFEQFFAETKYLTTAKGNNMPIYIQERVLPYSSNDSEKFSKKASEKSKEKAEEFSQANLSERLPLAWVADAIEFYGSALVEKFLTWLRGEHICDLHGGNIGYRMNGAPVILDYSGYWE